MTRILLEEPATARTSFQAAKAYRDLHSIRDKILSKPPPSKLKQTESEKREKMDPRSTSKPENVSTTRWCFTVLLTTLSTQSRKS
jgi:hypothetical protein